MKRKCTALAGSGRENTLLQRASLLRKKVPRSDKNQLFTTVDHEPIFTPATTKGPYSSGRFIKPCTHKKLQTAASTLPKREVRCAQNYGEENSHV